MEGAVTMQGFVARDDIAGLLGGAWLQVVPSVYEEPFGVVTIEAMMRGTALVATNTGGPSEVVREGETGSLVPSRDEHALADAIIRVLRDRGAGRTPGGERLCDRAAGIHGVVFDRVLSLYQTTMERFRRKRS